VTTFDINDRKEKKKEKKIDVSYWKLELKKVKIVRE